MPSIEAIYRKIFDDSNVWTKMLIGGLLSFVPVLNIFAFGYLYRYLRNLPDYGEFHLPRWNHLQGIFIDGLKCIVVFFIYCLIPILLLWLLSFLLDHMVFSSLGWLPYTFVSIGLITTPVLFASALYQFQLDEKWENLLELKPIVMRVLLVKEYVVVPSLAFVGLCLAGLPLFGFTFFLGMVVYLAYMYVLFISQDRGKI